MTNTAFPIIETPRLILRKIIAEDAQALFAIHGDAALMKWYGSNPLISIESAYTLIQVFDQWHKDNTGTRWGIQLKTNPEIIGTCGLFAWNKNWRQCIIGYELSKNHHGNGYMHEALHAMINWGFNNMQLNRIEAKVHPENVASIKRLEHLGFMKEGLLRQAGYWNEQHQDLCMYSLLHAEWLPQKQ